jgi:cell fate regulator YaaT (PSP1 superfamily)
MEKEEIVIDNSNYTHYVGVKFNLGAKAYFFGINNIELNIGDKVVVETARGTELGEIVMQPIEIAKYKSQLGLKPVIRIATDTDVKLHQSNLNDAKTALSVCEQEVNNLKLDMHLISSEYTLDKAKVIFSYVADDRVDFRELLKVLAYKLHTRIELRQVGPRDKAKMIGGLGMCGLPLCCSTFLNEFDGISINRAKNQMLAINIPKLSGHCGKLMCCLKYEDDAYTDLKKNYPEIGKEVFVDKVRHKVGAINVISGTVRLDNDEGFVFLSIDDYNKQFNQPNHNNNNKKFRHEAK